MSPSQETYASFWELVEQASSVLVVTRVFPTDDSIGSLVATGLALEKLGKDVTMVTHGPVRSTLSFLSGHQDIASSIDMRGRFVISLDTSAAKVADVTYDFDDDGNMLRICVTPEEGMYEQDRLRCDVQPGSFDLIVTVDAPDLDSLGQIYETSRDMFVSVPIANVDSDIANAQYGEANVVDATATSTAEVLVPLFEYAERNLVDASVATALLSGIVAGTRSFQHEATSSRAFTTAAQLVARGADQQRVVRSLFKNRSISGMKLWGRLFARVAYDEPSRTAWTSATRKDMEAADATMDDLDGIDDELAMSLPNVGRTVLFFEGASGKTHARVTCHEGDVLAVSRAFGIAPRGATVEVTQDDTSVEDMHEPVLSTLQTVPYEEAFVPSS